MRYVAAYLLAQLGGNAGPDADAIKAILSRFVIKSHYSVFLVFTIFYVPFVCTLRSLTIGSRVSEIML